MKLIWLISVSALFLSTISVLGQSPTSFWTLGDSVSLDFDSVTGPFIAGSHDMYGIESIATLNDASGNLLAYSNGYQIWNRDHQLLQGAEGLDAYQTGGGGSTISSATFFLATSDQRLYWFITITGIGSPTDSLGLGISASLLDFTLDSGLGGVVAGKSNLVVRTGVSEYLHAVRHSNGEDWWLYSRARDIGDTRIFKDLISDTGFVNFPNEDLGFELRGTIGNITSSSNGCYLAVVGYGSESLQDGGVGVYELDRANGSLTYIAHHSRNDGVYGVSFSPSSNLLYTSVIKPQIILQIDFESDDNLVIDTVLFEDLGLINLGQLRLADDGLIYFPLAYIGGAGTSAIQDDYLGAIELPDSIGMACSVNLQRLFIEPDPDLSIGLPAFPNYVTHPEICQEDSGILNVMTVLPETGDAIFTNSVGMTFLLRNSFKRIKVFDATGRMVFAKRNPIGILNLGSLQLGYYVVVGELQDGTIARQRVVVTGH